MKFSFVSPKKLVATVPPCPDAFNRLPAKAEDTDRSVSSILRRLIATLCATANIRKTIYGAGCVQPRRFIVLYTIAVVLLILWLLGLVTSTTIGGFIHVLLVIAVVVILLRVISGRRPI
jgi:hypothetical protein